MLCRVVVMPQGRVVEAVPGAELLGVLRSAGAVPVTPCGGGGRCGKCRVLVDGEEVLACQTRIHRHMTVTLPEAGRPKILTEGAVQPVASGQGGTRLAFDIGTSTVAGYLLDGETGRELACGSVLNPQASYGADVISRIGHALQGEMERLTDLIRRSVEELGCDLCARAGVSPGSVTRIGVVGNPAMQQLFLGILPDNLARIPFSPVLTQARSVDAGAYLPRFGDAELLIVPDFSGFVGADTLACILAAGLHEKEELTLLLDIGTNGEMVLGNMDRMVVCSAAAGPALEGAGIGAGMSGRTGAIDHVHMEDGAFRCSVIGGGKALGICGSGIIDAVAAALDAGLIDRRGRVLTEDRRICLTEEIVLTQEDIRQVQLAKGAIAAGIELMAARLGVELKDIRRVYLAGAFGTYMDPDSACRIGLIPAVLAQRITTVGNAAGGGAQMLSTDPRAEDLAQDLIRRVEPVELAAVPGFGRCFARNTRFPAVQDYWCQRAIGLGFSQAVPLDVATLVPRPEVRQMCAEDKCGAYGKNWTCPPHCGTLEECQERIRGYGRGILVQTVGITQKLVDTKAYRRTEERHLERFHALCGQIRAVHPHALCLGSGGCRICARCAFPEPCRAPEKACSSMEAYGLFVTQVCRDNGCGYHHGEKTVTYTACVLF